MYRLFAIALSAIVLMAALAMTFAPKAPAAGDVQENGPVATQADTSEQQALVLKRDGSGQFHLTAGVNGEDVRFLIDTGADMVALTVDEAERIGLGVDEAEFEPVMQTASGVGYGAPVHIDEMEVAGQTVHDVDAVVARGLSVNLLGQSVLRQLGKVELQGDRMVIRQR